MKDLIIKLLPNQAVKKIMRCRSHYASSRYKNLTPQEIFSKIYSEGAWGKSKDPGQPFYSGSGSHDEKTVPVYISAVQDILSSYTIKPAVVDIGCGDFSIGSQLRPMCGKYIACDIVPTLIEHNEEKYRSLDVDFRVVDLISDPLPGGNIVFIRQVLQHLTNEQIKQLIPKLKVNFETLILTEHLPEDIDFIPNIDHPAGPGIRLFVDSGIVLTEKPFNLDVLDEKVLCEVENYGGVIRTTMYKLK